MTVSNKPASPFLVGHQDETACDQRNNNWRGMGWHASPLQCFGATEGVFTEELKLDLQRRGIEDLLLLSLPEVPEAGSLPDALQQVELALREGGVGEFLLRFCNVLISHITET